MTEHEFDRVVSYVRSRYGINLSEKRTLIIGRMTNYLRKEGYDSLDSFMNEVEAKPEGKSASRLINILSTNHTYFMREFEQINFYKDVILRELKQREKRNRKLYIWCAAASTGEEPYMLAMTTRDFFAFEASEWDTRILATDINTKVLKHAVKGCYTKEQIDPLPESWKKRYIHSCQDGDYQIAEEIRNEVIFRQQNLMMPLKFMHKIHVVFIRNVMFYFDDETKLDLINRIYDIMEPGGYLIIGASESMERNHTKFQYVRPSIYKK